MFDHVTVRVSDRAAAERRYGAALARLGIAESGRDAEFIQWGDLSIAAAKRERPATSGLRIGLRAPAVDAIDAFDDGDGNRVEAVVADGPRGGGVVERLTLVVADLGASRRFWERIAPPAGLRVAEATTERLRFERADGGGGGALTLIAAGAREAGAGASGAASASAPTRGLHVAFPAPDTATVDAFHAAALAAGARDDGAPGPRPQYAPGYYAGFVLDPDGQSVELVHHA